MKHNNISSSEGIWTSLIIIFISVHIFHSLNEGEKIIGEEKYIRVPLLGFTPWTR